MYLKKIIRYGNRIDVYKYHTSRYGKKGEKRRKKQKPTVEVVKNANERRAVEKLYRKIVHNFPDGGWHLVLTYAPENLPDEKLAKKYLALFFDRLKRAYRKAGRELKWVATTEWERERIHHHIIINDCPGIAQILGEQWPMGGKHLTPLYPDGDYMGLAKYFVKETSKTFREGQNPWKKRYSCSRNMEEPEETVEVIQSSDWRKMPTVPKKLEAAGYILETDSIEQDVDVFGFPFMKYTLKQIEKNRRKRRE